MRRAILVAGVTALSAGGCSLTPYGEENLPPISEHGLRITKGVGTNSEYGPSIEVFERSTVQVLTEIADGNTVTVSAPRGPAQEITVTARVEDDPATTATSTMRSGSGAELTLHRLFEFDPGYIGVEDQSTAETLAVRIATPRLTGSGQGQVPFTFKMKAR